jgi:hypothetical protein
VPAGLDSDEIELILDQAEISLSRILPAGLLTMTKALPTASLLGAIIVASAFLAPAAHAASPPGPKKCYQSYLRSLYYAKDLNDVAGFWAKKRSRIWISMKPESKQKKLDSLRSLTYVGGNCKVVSEKIDGTSAHLIMKGSNCATNKVHVPVTVEADLVQEDGYWKICDASTKYGGKPVVAAR